MRQGRGRALRSQCKDGEGIQDGGVMTRTPTVKHVRDGRLNNLEPLRQLVVGENNERRRAPDLKLL